MRNWDTSIGTYTLVTQTSGTYTPLQTNIPLVTGTILADPNSYAACAEVESTLTTFYQVVEDYIDDNDGDLPVKTNVVYTYFPAQLYPEYYIDDPIRGGVEQNDVMVHKDTALTYATILDNSYAFFNSVDTAIAEVKDIEKRITLTGVVGDIITGEVTITDTGASTSIVMNVEDVNEDGSVNLSWDRDTDDDGVNDEDASEVVMDLSFYYCYWYHRYRQVCLYSERS